MMTMPQTSLFLPRPVEISACGVSLYNKGKEVTLALDADLSAIVGANGLGKSTLLNLIVYAITGIVRKPDGVVDSAKGSRGFLDQGVEHAIAYFDGRVIASSKQPPYVEIAYMLGPHRVTVRRGFFSTETVTHIAVDGRTRTPTDASKCEESYRRLVCTLGRVASFEQFALFVYALQYFGEDHYCLFWNQLILNQIITAAVAGDATEGERMADLIQEFKKHDSHFRNIQWQITREKEVARELAGKLSDKPLPKGVVEKYADAQERVLQLRARLVDTADAIAVATAARDETQIEIDQAKRALEAHTWSAVTSRRLSLAKSPLLMQMAAEQLCPVCRTAHRSIPNDAAALISLSTCPLCRVTVVPKSPSPAFEEKTKELRSELRKCESALARNIEKLEDCTNRYESAQKELSAVQSSIGRMELSYRRELLDAAVRAAQKGDSDGKLADIERKITSLAAKKEEHRTHREIAAKSLSAAQKKLMDGFSKIKGQVVPKFQKLAREFLGLSLTLSARLRREEQVPIVDFHITVEGSERRRAEQLSESQRYFLDIALRMTLLSWISHEQWTPFLAIDTPEGALDIAYETNAGIMFGTFLTVHGGALLTASNLNSSRLIRRTLEGCRDSGKIVSLHDLREWATTTTVQNEHKPLMDAQIEELRGLTSSKPRTSART